MAETQPILESQPVNGCRIYLPERTFSFGSAPHFGAKVQLLPFLDVMSPASKVCFFSTKNASCS